MPAFTPLLRWIAATIAMLALATAPIGVTAELALGSAVIVAMFAVKRLGSGAVQRHVYLALGTLIVLRYVWWRTTETLPPIDDLVGFSAGLTLYVAEMFCVGMLFISLFVIADPLQRPPARRLKPEDCPSVDVFVPSYDESAELVAATLAAATTMDWPADKLRVHLLDDGGTTQKRNAADPVAAAESEARHHEMKALAENLGAIYLTREKNVSAKAGNLNAALAQTSGDLIAVFDADHAPTHDFLQETVGHFAEDPRLFLVQTPHFFLNPDPIEKNLVTWARMPSENEMFYSVIQRGLDRWNAAFFCGSAAVLRRSALEEAGGFSGISITEDCETALDLHSRGWTSRFVDKPMIAGLQPETLAQFIGQRSRWCRGMVQILMMKNPLFKSGLSMAQRIAYLSSSLFWLFPLPRAIFVVAPLLYIFFGVKLYVANVHEFVAYTVIYMIVNMLMQNHLYGRVRWPWISELYEYIQMPYLTRAIGSVVMNPKKPTFNVTAKGVVTEEARLSELAKPYFVIFAVLAAASVVAFQRFFADPEINDLMLVVGLWNTFNLVIAGVALGVVAERPERRRAQRLDVAHKAEFVIGDTVLPVVVEDISIGGVRLRPLGHVPAGLRLAGAVGTLIVGVERTGGPAHVTVRARRIGADEHGVFWGMQFDRLTSAGYRVVAEVMYGHASVLDRFRERRRSGKSLVSGTAQFLRWAIGESGRAVQLAARRKPGRASLPAQGELIPLATVEDDRRFA
ncbi:MAG: UDP-forming cellulose synthase catalytic subunit [Siculibacillus sp.]|nr:UDP-forming cellulose synthase catalytic subunit [Siculibacillus sp.]